MKKRIIIIISVSILIIAIAFGAVSIFADNYPSPIPSSFANTGDMRYDIVQHALSQVGYREGSNNWNVFGNSFGNAEGAWCAYFIQWCARRAGIPLEMIPESRFGRVSDYWENAVEGIEFHPVNDYEAPYIPKAGDLVIYRNVQTYYDRSTGEINTYATANSFSCRLGIANGTSNSISHIGIVTRDAVYPTNNGSSVNQAGFCMVDGNWKDSVASRFELYTNITGFVSINYPEAATPNISAGEWPILRKGSTGANVSIMQAMLNAAIGAGIEVDGEFDTDTAIAVIRYQTWNGLLVDGQVGPETWQSLISKSVQTSGSFNWGITRQLQKLLNNRFGIKTTVDGGYGSETTASVKEFQKLAGINPDGKVGPYTWKLLICGLKD